MADEIKMIKARLNQSEQNEKKMEKDLSNLKQDVANLEKKMKQDNRKQTRKLLTNSRRKSSRLRQPRQPKSKSTSKNKSKNTCTSSSTNKKKKSRFFTTRQNEILQECFDDYNRESNFGEWKSFNDETLVIVKTILSSENESLSFQQIKDWSKRNAKMVNVLDVDDSTSSDSDEGEDGEEDPDQDADDEISVSAGTFNGTNTDEGFHTQAECSVPQNRYNPVISSDSDYSIISSTECTNDENE